MTWTAQEELARHWQLLLAYRRGFPPSPAAQRQDWEVDASDLEDLLGRTRAHAVGFSYGGLGLTVAAGRRPDRVCSLTLIEVPLFELANAQNPEMRRLLDLASAYTSEAPDAHGEARAEFETLAGMGGDLTTAQRAELARARELARGLRPPAEAHPDYDAIVRAGVPVLVVSGGHEQGLEELCDAIAARLHGRRVCLPGAGHAVQRTPGFNQVLVDFIGRSTE